MTGGAGSVGAAPGALQGHQDSSAHTALSSSAAFATCAWQHGPALGGIKAQWEPISRCVAVLLFPPVLPAVPDSL